MKSIFLFIVSFLIINTANAKLSREVAKLLMDNPSFEKVVYTLIEKFEGKCADRDELVKSEGQFSLVFICEDKNEKLSEQCLDFKILKVGNKNHVDFRKDKSKQIIGFYQCNFK